MSIEENDSVTALANGTDPRTGERQVTHYARFTRDPLLAARVADQAARDNERYHLDRQMGYLEGVEDALRWVLGLADPVEMWDLIRAAEGVGR